MTDREALRAKVAGHLGSQLGAPVEVSRLEPLAGGACQDNWRVELARDGQARRYVMRSDSLTSLPNSIARAAELRVVNAAVRAGVRTPEARWPAQDLVRAGATAYFLDWVPGEAIGRRVVKAPQLEAARQRLPEELGAELARIHSITPANAPELSAALPPASDGPAEALAQVRQMLDARAHRRPALELAWRWLAETRPRPAPIVLVHGDYRVGNFLVDERGLQAVLDWEFAHFGSAAQDLAWISVRDWRFGRLELPVGGVSAREPFYRAYEQAGGRPVDRAEVHWWEVFGNVGWALGSLQQGDRYLKGDHDLELIAVQRRAEEMEWEALRLIEKGA